MDSRLILEAACVALGLLPPRPAPGDAQKRIALCSKLLFADWASTQRKCEEAFFTKLEKPVAERLHKILMLREVPTLEWTFKTNRCVPPRR